MMLSDAVVLNIVIAFVQFAILAMLVLHCVSVSRNQSAAALHWLLLNTLLLAFLLPVAHVYFPKFNIVLLGGPINDFAQLFSLSAQAKSLLVSLFQAAFLFGLTYASINAFVSLLYLPKIQSLCTESSREWSALERVCRILKINSTVTMGYSSSVNSACTWGLFRPQIALPMEAVEWSDDTLQRVLHHECCHIRRKDWLISLLVNYARRVLWFVPFSGTLAKKIHWFAELACDDSVLKCWSRQEYADDLLMLAKYQSNSKYFPSYEVVNGLDYGEAYARIDAVLDPTRVRTGIANSVIVVSLVVLLGSLMLSILRFDVDHYWSQIDVFTEVSVASKQDEKTPAASPTEIADVQNGSEDTFSDSASIQDSWHKEAAGIPVIPIKLAINSSSNPIVTQPVEDFVNIGNPALSMSESLVHEILPEYPRAALNRGKEGSAQIKFDINTKGEPYNIRVISSEPYASFGRAAVEAVRRYQYTPKIEAGRPIKVINKTEMFYFRIKP